MPSKWRNAGGEVEAGGDATSATDTTGSTMWYSALFANFGAKGTGGASIGVKLWTLLAGVRTLAATFAGANTTLAGTLTLPGEIKQDAGANNLVSRLKQQSTNTVAAVATTIATLQEPNFHSGAVAVVSGHRQGFGPTRRFTDIVAWSYQSGAVTAIASHGGVDADARVYTSAVGSRDLQLNMSGIQEVNVVFLEMSGRA
jgi:hypothetical protein